MRHFDFLLVGTVLAISAIGLVMIWSTTHHRVPGDELYFVKRQAMFFAVGIVAMFAVIAIDYRRLRDQSMFAYFATIGLLLAVLAPLGSNIKGHQAWFQLPGGFTLQPSEFAKFGIIVALAGYCNQYRGELDAWRLATILALAAVPIGLVFLQPDLGTVLVLVVIIVGLLMVAGITGRQLLVLAAARDHRRLRRRGPRHLEAVPDRPVHVVRRSRKRELARQRLQPGAVEAGHRARPFRR